MTEEILRLLILCALVLGAKGEPVDDILIAMQDGRCVYYDGSQLPMYGDEDCSSDKPSELQCELHYGQPCPWISMTEAEEREFKVFRYELMLWAYEELFGEPYPVRARQGDRHRRRHKR